MCRSLIFLKLRPVLHWRNKGNSLVRVNSPPRGIVPYRPFATVSRKQSTLLPTNRTIAKRVTPPLSPTNSAASLYYQLTILFYLGSCSDVLSNAQCVVAVTFQVGNSQRVAGADYALESIHNIREAIPQLWEVDRLAEVNYSGVAVETSVTA